MKRIVVGDPHVQVSNLKDSRNLFDFILKTAKDNKIDEVLFLGDLMHTHAIIRSEVLDFWRLSFASLEKKGIKCLTLVGNHDQVGSKEGEQNINSLNPFVQPDMKKMKKPLPPKRYIINKPMIIDGIGYVPYHSDEESFIQASKDLYEQGATGLLVAHQTFTGAQYENGFFSEEGIDPALVPQDQVLSGHVHLSQSIGKCFYPGTPKWDTMSDANQDKGIWIFTHDETGKYTDKEFISTKDIVTPITSYVVKEGEDIPDLNPSARNYVTLEGKSVWITKVKKKLKDIANIKVKPTDRRVVVNVENIANIDKYLENEFVPIEGVSKKDIKKHMELL